MEILRFDDLAPHLMLKNGNFLYKVPFRGGWAVLKVYYGTRGAWACLRKSFGNIVLHGQTSYMPKARRRVERECMSVWSRNGFRVFEVYDDVEVVAPGCPPGGYLLMEYRPGPKLVDFIRDGKLSLEDRFAVYRRFLKEWSRRHELAISGSDPRLVHENGDGKHVLIFDDGFLWFDFEMIYRRRSKVRSSVSHEIIQYLWNLMRQMPAEMQDRFLGETVSHYPVRERLRDAGGYLFRNPNPFLRLGRWIDRRFTGRGRKPTSKYNAVRRLMAAMEKA